MNCCETTSHEITVQTASSTLSMLRCTACGRQTWVRDGEAIEREQAFTHLADAFQSVPRQAKAARERTAAETAERGAARRARKAPLPTVSETPAEPALVDLLAGWQVLGASA